MPNRRIQQSLKSFQPSIAHWLALVSAAVAFAIVSDSLLFPTALAFASLIYQALRSPKRLHRNRERAPTAAPGRATLAIAASALRFLIPFCAYLFALLPLWPESLWLYYGAPAAAIFAVALLAALNQESYGGSRGFTSIAAIAFLLLIRNIVIFYEFEAPFLELAYAAAFVAFMEIGLSTRFRNSQEHPHPELMFGLLLVVIASFSFKSLPLAVALATLPVISFLIRNYRLARISKEHTRPAEPVSPAPPKSAKAQPYTALLTALPLLIASILYLLSLRLPFWTDYVPEKSPYLVNAIAQRAKLVSDASSLDDQAAQSLADAMVTDPETLKRKAREIVGALSRRKAKDPDAPPPRSSSDVSLDSLLESLAGGSQRQDSRPRENYQTNYTQGPFNRNRSSPERPLPGDAVDLPTFPFQQKPEPSNLSNAKKATAISSPRSTIGSGMPSDIPLDAFELDNESFADFSGPSIESALPPSPPPEATEEPPIDFETFLSEFETPERAIAETLNLEGNDISALLNEKPLVTVSLGSSNDAPRRLYMRTNVLDTVSKSGINAIRAETGIVEVETQDDRIVRLQSFLQSKSLGSTLTITAQLPRSPALPLPESFQSIQVFNTDSIDVYPDERVAIAPKRSHPLTFKVYQADLEVTDRERKDSHANDAYLRRLLEVPLSQSDRDYLKALASRVGGSSTPTRRFAYRFANYFSHRHAYSYFVSIPSGPEHAVVRWLKNESPGLCSNYAAAFTLLARSRGIPTRVVGGFATDEYDSRNRRYVLRQNNAHAWVEYLDESGQWIRFDPTPGITEAEIRRVEEYVTPAPAFSLRELLQAELKNLFPEATEETAGPVKPDAATPEADSLSDVPVAASDSIADTASLESPQIGEITSPLVDSRPSRTHSRTMEAESKNARQPSPPSASETQAREVEKRPDRIDTSIAPAQRTPEPPPVSDPQNPQASEPASPPWLMLLTLFALVIPGIFYLLNVKAEKTATPEVRLRHQAGRLLARLEALIQKHQLEADPVWNETRETLHAQRYGREPNATLVNDISVKVSLLAKKKS